MITPPSSTKPPEGTISFGEMPKIPPPPEPDSQPQPKIDQPLAETPPPVIIPSNPWPKRFIAIVIVLMLLVAGLFGGRFIFSMIDSSKQVTLTYWGLWENEVVVKPVIAAFEAKNPKIKIQYIKQSQKQYRERLQAAIDRGEGPDIFRFHNTWVPMLYNQLSTVPQTVMTPVQFKNAFYPVASADLVAGETIYGIPLMIDGLGLYYNEELFARAGITAPPSTWEELLTMIPKIAKLEGENFTVSAIALGTTNNVEHYSDILATMMMQNGADLTSPTSKEAEEALAFYHKFATPQDPIYTWNETMDNSIYAFAIGKVAMILAPSWRAFDIHEINPNVRFKIAPIPQLPGNTINWATYWVEGVSNKSKYQKQAWEFTKFLTSKEGATIMYSEAQKARKLFGEPYALVELGTTIKDDPYIGAYISQAATAKSFPLASRTFDNGLNDKLIVYLQNAINGKTTGSSEAERLETMTAGFKQIFSTYGLVTNTAPTTIQ
ncbi:MAG: sugar ABC transporter substrate-binding protein [Candidatus Gottesmanbacteria bacterium]